MILHIATKASIGPWLVGERFGYPVSHYTLPVASTPDAEVVDSEHCPLALAHLSLMLRQAEVVVLLEMPPSLWLIRLLNAGVPILALDTPEARACLGPGAVYFADERPEAILDATYRLRQDPGQVQVLLRRGRAHVRRLLRRTSLGDVPLPVPERVDARYFQLIYPRTSSAWTFSGGLSVEDTRRDCRLLVLILASGEDGLAETLHSLEAGDQEGRLRLVVVWRAADPELKSRLRVFCEGRAELVFAPEAGYAEAIAAGLELRQTADGAVIWLEAGTAFNDPDTLSHWWALLQEHQLAGVACETQSPELLAEDRFIVPELPGFDSIARPGVLWDLDWLYRTGAPDVALPKDAVDAELGLRALRAGARFGLDLGSRIRPAPAVPTSTPGARVRCGILTPALQIGGAERWIISLLESTDSRIEWKGVALVFPQRFDVPIASEVEHICPIYRGDSAVVDLAHQCELLVVWGLPSWWDLLPSNYSGRVILVAHGSDNWTVEVFRGSERAHSLALVSEAARQALAPHEQSRAPVLHNAVNPVRVVPIRSRDAMRAAWGIAPEARVLGFIGRFSPEKDPLALARALRYLPPDWVGVMIGWSEQLEQLQLQANALAPGRLRWPGPTTDIGSALGSMDALLVSSSAEGFCYVLAEAWLARVPTISTRVGIACEQPHLVREIPVAAHGAAIAAAVLSDEADPANVAVRVEQAHAFATEELAMERFGRRWAGELLTAAGANPWGRSDRLPGIQVVITGYNVEPWLKRCLDSVEEALAGCRWQLCLADDGSTDGTWSLIQAHKSHALQVRRKRFPKARNAGQAKNRALRLGLPNRKQYPALLFMDADDVMPRTRVTHLLRSAVEGAYRLAHGALRFNAPVPGVEPGYIMAAEPDQQHRLCICPPAMVMHESLVPPDGQLFCEDLDAMEDGELLCRWELAGIHSAPLNGPVIHEYWPRFGSVMLNERLAENQQRFWERVAELRDGKRPLHLEHLQYLL